MLKDQNLQELSLQTFISVEKWNKYGIFICRLDPLNQRGLTNDVIYR